MFLDRIFITFFNAFLSANFSTSTQHLSKEKSFNNSVEFGEYSLQDSKQQCKIQQQCLIKYLSLFVVLVFICCSHVTAQHIESYGFSIGGNNTWIRLESGSIIDDKEKNTGLNFGAFALWDSPTIGQLKTQLEFAHKEFVFRRGPRENSFGRQFGPTNYFSEFNYFSLSIAPVFHLSALKLDDYYILVGAKLDFIWSSKVEI